MADKFFMLAIIFALTLSLGFVIACGDDDDDDDDDDDGDDDDDDDDTAVDLCKEAFAFLTQDCEFVFTDTEGNDMTLDDLYAICEAGEGDACIINCYDSYDTCDDMGTCIEGCFA